MGASALFATSAGPAGGAQVLWRNVCCTCVRDGRPSARKTVDLSSILATLPGEKMIRRTSGRRALRRDIYWSLALTAARQCRGQRRSVLDRGARAGRLSNGLLRDPVLVPEWLGHTWAMPCLSPRPEGRKHPGHRYPSSSGRLPHPTSKTAGCSMCESGDHAISASTSFA